MRDLGRCSVASASAQTALVDKGEDYPIGEGERCGHARGVRASWRNFEYSLSGQGSSRAPVALIARGRRVAIIGRW